MKTKTIHRLFFTFFILFSAALFTGCSRSGPEKAVKRELDLIKKLDEPTIRAFISYEDMMNSKTADTDIDSKTTEAVKLFFRNFDYRILKTTATENTATVYVEITNLDTHKLAKDACLALVEKSTDAENTSSMTLNSYFQLLGDVLKKNEYELVTTEAEIALLNTEDGWSIQNTDQLEDDLVSGFITCLKDPYLVTPEEMITVVLENLSQKTPDEWKTYLNMNDIFSTGSQNYARTDNMLAEQLSKYVSYQILSVTEDKDARTALAHVKITSLDMTQVLDRYQDLLMDYAASTKSVRATDSERADQTALLLEQVLKENTATIDTEVEIPFTNNGSTWEMQLNESFSNALLGNAGAAIETFQNETTSEE